MNALDAGLQSSVAAVMLVLTVFFAYAGVSGCVRITSSMRNDKVRAAGVLATVVGLCAITRFTLYHAMKGEPPAGRTLPIMRMNELLLHEDSVFAGYAASSHTICVLMGVIIRAWESSRSRSVAVVGAMHALFAAGTFIWFSVLGETAAYISQSVSLGIQSEMLEVSVVDAALLTISHTLAFCAGHLLHQDYLAGGFHKRPQSEMTVHYGWLGVALSVAPVICDQICHLCFAPAMASSVSVQLKGVVLPLVFGLYTGHGRLAFAVVSMWAVLSIPGLRQFVPMLPEAYLYGIAGVLLTVLVSFLWKPSRRRPLNLNQGPEELWSAPRGCTPSVAVIAAGGVVAAAVTVGSIVPGLAVPALAFLGGVCITMQFSGSTPHPDAPELKTRRQNAYRSKTYPPAYPNGWYKVAMSHEVPHGKMLYRQYLGQHFVVFRGHSESAGAAVLDAFCPHLGANLAMGGEVVGDCIQCPFHAWTFASDGKVQDIPYYDGSIPKQANAKAWHSVEHYGMIMVWFDAEEREPTWFLPRVEAIDGGKMTYRDSHKIADIGMHIQEWSENGVDYAHFSVLHSKMMLPWTTWTIPGIDIEHKGRFFMDEDNPHISYFEDIAHLKIGGVDFPRTEAVATIHFIGPGGLIYLNFCIPDLGNILLFESHTPREPLVLKTDFMWYADKTVPDAIVWYVIGSWFAQETNDLVIWNNKVYKDPPVILKTDGPVGKFRRWYKQFYSENSSEFCKESSYMDW